MPVLRIKLMRKGAMSDEGFFSCRGLVLSGLATPGRDVQHETQATNIEIPVRVFAGDEFIEGLKIDDFEV